MITEKASGNLIDRGAVAYADFTVTVTYAAGTIGTRGAQYAVNLSAYYSAGYRAVSATVVRTQASDKYLPFVMLWDEVQQLLLNAYRASTNAMPEAKTIVRVFFVKE